MRPLTRANTVIGSIALAAAIGLVAADLVVRADAPPTAPSAAPTVSPASPSDAPSAAPSDEPGQFTVLVSGDVLLRDTLWEQASADSTDGGYDFAPMLAGVRPAVESADLAICHLETPVGPPGGPYSDYPIFNVPPQIIPALAATGYDVCTTASNHTIDKGEAGVVRTLDALDAAGIMHAGAARSAAEAGEPAVVAVGAARVAILSYTYGLNGLQRPSGKEWIVDLIDEDVILGEAAAARGAGADVVLVALHWGLEYRNDPTQDQRELAAALAASPDIDVIYGHHAHVAQPFDVVAGKWVVYGLGNHLAEQATQPERTHEGVMARFTFTEDADDRWAVTGVEYLPTLIPLQPPFRLIDLTVERSGAADEAAYERIGDIVDGLGASEHGLRPAG